jgi:hypothetical protein
LCSRSSEVFDHRCRQCSFGKPVKASISGPCVVHRRDPAANWSDPNVRRRFCSPTSPANGLGGLVEALCFGQRGEGLERGVFELPYSFAGDAEGSADLLERPRLSAVEAEAQLD